MSKPLTTAPLGKEAAPVRFFLTRTSALHGSVARRPEAVSPEFGEEYCHGEDKSGVCNSASSSASIIIWMNSCTRSRKNGFDRIKPVVEN
jgi:hypothetical protein